MPRGVRQKRTFGDLGTRTTWDAQQHVLNRPVGPKSMSNHESLGSGTADGHGDAGAGAELQVVSPGSHTDSSSSAGAAAGHARYVGRTRSHAGSPNSHAQR